MISWQATCDPVRHVGVAAVEGDVGMQVAVAGVEDVADAEPVAVADLGDPVHDVGQGACAGPRRPGRRDRARSAPWRRTPSCGPAQSRARSAASDALAHRARAALAAGSAAPSPPRPRPRPPGRRARPAARRRRRSDSPRRRSRPRPRRRRPGPSSPCAAGTMPGRDDRRRRPRSRRATVGKSASSVRTLGGIGSSRTVISVAMPNMPSLPTNSADQVGAPGLAVRRAERDRRAVGQHDLELRRRGWS